MNPPVLDFVNGLRGLIENESLGFAARNKEETVYTIPAQPMTVVVDRHETKIMLADASVVVLASESSADVTIRGAHQALYRLIRKRHQQISREKGGAISPPR